MTILITISNGIEEIEREVGLKKFDLAEYGSNCTKVAAEEADEAGFDADDVSFKISNLDRLSDPDIREIIEAVFIISEEETIENIDDLDESQNN